MFNQESQHWNQTWMPMLSLGVKSPLRHEFIWTKFFGNVLMPEWNSYTQVKIKEWYKMKQIRLPLFVRHWLSCGGLWFKDRLWTNNRLSSRSFWLPQGMFTTLHHWCTLQWAPFRMRFLLPIDFCHFMVYLLKLTVLTLPLRPVMK